jgi:hypothetical protein
MVGLPESGQLSAPTITLRAPSSHTVKTAAIPPEGAEDVVPPPYAWIKGTWYVSYSSLPLWKGKQNVRITYKALEGYNASVPGRMPHLDDHVEYQKAGSVKTSNVHGVSKPVDITGLGHGLAYAWRGKGMLAVASSSWEILAYGKDNYATEPNDYAVTYFGKTLFTPAGLDIYTRTTASLTELTLNAIKAALEEQEGLGPLAKSMFEIPRVPVSESST